MNPADLLSFIGRALGFWPAKSLACITVDRDKVGATLRIDLPKTTRLRTPLRPHRHRLPGIKRTSNEHDLRPLHHAKGS